MTHHTIPGGRAPGLDLLRAGAILTVMLYHLASHGFALDGFGHHGWLGVDLFFVLSGYLIGWQVVRRYADGKRPDWPAFMLGRALRVLPAYLAVLGLYLAVPAWREADRLPPLWQFFTFTLNLFPDWDRARAYSHAWSLCVEEHFYLLLPPAAMLLARHPGPGKVLAAAVLLVVGGMVSRDWTWQRSVAPHLGAGGDPGLAIQGYVERIYDPTWHRLDGLLAGVLLASVRAFRPAWWMRVLRHGPLLLILGAACIAAVITIDPLGRTGAVVQFPLAALGFACLVAAMLSPRLPFSRVALPGCRQAALLAFSLYLTHRQVYAWLDARLDGMPAAAPLTAFVVYNLAALAVAALLYWSVEWPALRMRDRLLAMRAARMLTAAARPALIRSRP
jgi:peptidoglycan/LPS O-acetylase OafA/YrhL